MTDSIAFTVTGAAKSQGSKSYKGHRNGVPILVESSKGLAHWRRDVRLVAGLNMTGDPWSGPVRVVVEFFYARPASHLLADGVSLSAAGRRAPYPGRRADIDKACRGILDSLTGVVFCDDDQVVSLAAGKQWGERDEARVRCWRVVVDEARRAA